MDKNVFLPTLRVDFITKDKENEHSISELRLDKNLTIDSADVDTGVGTLLRERKVPVWIDISVSAIQHKKTVLTLLCAGRYSDDVNEFYYRQRSSGPFGVKSPNLPVDHNIGDKFKLAETNKMTWAKIFGMNRR